MTDYQSLLEVKNNFFEEYHKTLLAADDSREQETSACITLQRLARGVKDRMHITKKKYVAYYYLVLFRLS